MASGPPRALGSSANPDSAAFNPARTGVRSVLTLGVDCQGYSAERIAGVVALGSVGDRDGEVHEPFGVDHSECLTQLGGHRERGVARSAQACRALVPSVDVDPGDRGMQRDGLIAALGHRDGLRRRGLPRRLLPPGNVALPPTVSTPTPRRRLSWSGR